MALTGGARAALLLLLGAPALASAQGVAPIRDNSFLIEEAYNQDRNVVQHIGVLTTGSDDGWAFNITDEWPLGGLRDQLSLGATLVEDAAGTSFGDLALSYRRQLIGHPDAAVVVSPRITLLGVFGDGLDAGLGMEANIPVTAVLGDALVSHWNLGTVVGAGPATVEAGASLVWLVAPWVNFLVEGLFIGAEREVPRYLVSPGVRAAVNLGALQVVPGVALPIDVGDRGGSEVLFYLSIEHPFGS